RNLMLNVPDFSLTGKLALITGSTQGLGLAIAQAYSASGARVLINGRNEERTARVVEQLRAEGAQAHGFVQDLEQVQDLQEAYRALCLEQGTPDVLVNNVGIRIRKGMGEATLQEIVQLINIDLIAAIELSRLAARAMAAS